VALAALALGLALSAGCRSSSPRSTPPSASGDAVSPTRYRLELDLDPRRTTFHGHVSIAVEVHRPVRSVSLDAVDLEFAHVTVRQGERVQEPSVNVMAERELVSLDLASALTVGRAIIEIDYSGALGSEVGLFRHQVDGLWYVFSDFQPVDARRAFPGFDRPRFRTPWTVSAVIPRGLVAAGNMPIAGRRAARPGFERIDFAETPPLPSYLVGLAVGPFDVAEGPDAPVKVRALTVRGRAHMARTALALMPLYLHWLADYTGIEPPLTKLDLVAVPGLDGAMENHGLFTFNEDILLMPVDDTASRQLLHMVLAHEAAHIWFGNLVGFRRWNDLWLSEGFATFMADEVGMALHPDETVDVRQIVYRQDAMHVDRYPGVRAIDELDRGPRAAEGAFDPLSYKKAGAVLGTARAFLGADEFRAAIRRYLAGERGKAVRAEVLRSYLSTTRPEAGAIVADLVDRPGVPLLTASASCAGGRATVRIAQSRLRWMPGDPGAGSAPWTLPVCVRYGDDEGSRERCVVSAAAELEVPLDSCPLWWSVNGDGRTYAELAVDADAAKRLARMPLKPREWAALVDAIDAALDAGTLAPRDSFALLAAALEQKQQHVTELVLRVTRRLVRHLQGDERAALNASIGRVVAERARALGFRGAVESVHDRIHRGALLVLAGTGFDDSEIVAAAREIADATFAGTGVELPRAMRVAALEIVAHHMDPAAVDALVDRCESERDLGRLRDMVGTLASVARADSATRVLERVAGSQRLRPFLAHLVIGLAGTPTAASAALSLLSRSGASSDEPGLLRDRFSVGLCDPESIPILDRVVPPEEGDLAADRIRRCWLRRKLWRASTARD